MVTLGVLLEKHALRRIFAQWKANQPTEKNVLIIGTGAEARRIFSFLLNSPDLRLNPVAFFQDNQAEDSRLVYSHGYRFKEHAKVFSGRFDDELLRSHSVSEIFIADATLSNQRIADITAVASRCSASLSFLTSLQPPLVGSAVNFSIMDGLFVSSFSGGITRSLGYELCKRCLDVSVALALTVTCLPVLIVCAMWVKCTSQGPVFFRQKRIGQHAKSFEMLKFRSMYVSAPTYGPSPDSSSDPRITSAGRFLRKTSLDELPQLLNVLMGHMSLVGPRPEMPYVVEGYTGYQKHRLSVPQGLTGMWQLSADRKHAIHESLEYDLYYIENRGIFMDMAILLHTVAFATKGI